MKQRIWELDAFRGLCILGVIIVHFGYDLIELYELVSWDYPNWFLFIKEWGGILFILLSGLCVTLGSRSVRRGLIVFVCGMIITAVTAGMYWLNMAGKGIIIYFGVLHCLGVCMLLWPLFKRLPWWALAGLGIVLVILGFFVQNITTQYHFLLPLGIMWDGFKTSDYFPLLPNLGYFLIGSALGRTVYRNKSTLLPQVRADKGVLGFLQWCGRQSLPIYLLHQPILASVCYLIMLFK